MGEILCSFITNFIVEEIQCGECLCKIGSECYNDKMKMLLRFVVEHQQDVVLH
jgi:hypothetical protein